MTKGFAIEHDDGSHSYTATTDDFVDLLYLVCLWHSLFLFYQMLARKQISALKRKVNAPSMTSHPVWGELNFIHPSEKYLKKITDEPII